MSSPTELAKDVTIGAHVYQISKMDARTACWIAMQIMTKILPGNLGDQVAPNLPGNRSQISEEEFHNIQDHCLAVCGRYEVVGSTSVATAIMPRPGVWAFKDLAGDPLTIMSLTVHSLIFNCASFFQGDGLKEVLASFRDLKLFNPSK